jgi:hypothetical protein
MATPRKRSTSGFSEKPKDENVESQEIEEFFDSAFAEVVEQVEKQEEQVLPEIIPTEDAGPRFVETPVVETQPEPVKIEEKKPKRHPRNVPRFSRIAK